MKNHLLFLPFITAILLFPSCNQEGEAVTSAELDNVKAENLILKRELAEKDSAVNNYMAYVNEVRENLSVILSKQQHLAQLRSQNPEFKMNESDELIADIKAINELRLKNEATIAALRRELKNNSGKIGELEKLVLSLSEEVEKKNREIYDLQLELENLDAAFSQLFETFTEQQDVLDQQTEELNQAFYTIGTSKELQENGVITKEGGFVGIGKSKKMKADFNQSYFTSIDITQINEITINHKKADLITTHPAGSFELVTEDGMIKKLVIKNAKNFWSVSKYVVIVVG